MDDTDDEYYFRLLQEELIHDDDQKDEILLNEYITVESQGKQSDEQDSRRDAECWNLEQVELRQRERIQAKRSRRLKTARKRALDALGLEKVPKETFLKQRYHKAKGVHARLMDALEIRQQESNERAREYVVDREAKLAALHADKDKKRVGQLEYLKTIERVREHEAFQTRTLTDLALADAYPKDSIIEDVSDEDLVTVLRIRGNIKSIRRLKKRETILGLLLRSFEIPLY